MKKEYGKDGNNGINRRVFGKVLKISVCSVISVFSVFFLPVFSYPQSPDKRLERERERAYAREQFSKNFRDLQLLGKGLLRDHEATKLTPGKLAKDAKSINRCARTLRSLIALGDMASEVKINREIDTAPEFDDSIHNLAQLIWDFAHNPVHQSNKVFNTDLAEQAQTDLLTIINLSKALESKSRRYVALPPIQAGK
jgi:hypothetical protein